MRCCGDSAPRRGRAFSSRSRSLVRDQVMAWPQVLMAQSRLSVEMEKQSHCGAARRIPFGHSSHLRRIRVFPSGETTVRMTTSIDTGPLWSPACWLRLWSSWEVRRFARPPHEGRAAAKVTGREIVRRTRRRERNPSSHSIASLTKAGTGDRPRWRQLLHTAADGS